VSYSGDLTHYDPAAGVARRVEENLMGAGVPCGYDGVSAWTGSEVLVWGGQSCAGEPGAPPTLATGARIRIDP
jgi:hypothetical protein